MNELTEDMNGLSTSSIRSRKVKKHTSMDLEFHDVVAASRAMTGGKDPLDRENEHERDSDAEDNSDSSTSWSGDDSFCAASDTCEPDSEFMHAMLEEEHPDRLNLLELAVPRKEKKDETEGESASLTDPDPTEVAHDDDEDDDEGDSATESTTAPHEDEVPVSPHSSPRRKSTLDDDDSETTDEGDDIMSSPVPSRPRPRPDPALLQNMGKSAKKSLRTVAGGRGNFFSKSFRSLGKNLSGSFSRRKKKTDDQSPRKAKKEDVLEQMEQPVIA